MNQDSFKIFFRSVYRIDAAYSALKYRACAANNLVNQPAAPTPDTPGDSGTHGGASGGEQGGTTNGSVSGTGAEAKSDGAADGKGDTETESESDGKWHMPTNPRKRRALVQTGYTAGGLAAGIVVAGVVAMIARAARRRRR